MKDTEDNEEPPDISDIDLPCSRPGPDAASGRRRIEVTLTIGLAALLVLVILGTDTPLRDTIVQRFFGPTPTPTTPLIPGDDLFYIQVAPWGSVSIDGHIITHLPSVDKDPPLRLSRGLHQVVWRADPFRPVGCIVSVPDLLGNEPCRLYESPAARSHARLITFTASLANLPDNQRSALVQQVQAVLDALPSTDTVQPGEQYAYSLPDRLVVKTATQPLRATLGFHLDTNPSNANCFAFDWNVGQTCTFQGQDCHLFCTPIGLKDVFTGTGLPGSPPSKSWDPLAIMYSTWQYATLGGHTVAQDQPDVNNLGVEDVVALHITWDSMEWHVSILTRNAYPDLPTISGPACAAAQNNVQDGYYQVTGGSVETGVDWRFSAGKNSAAGCLAIATPRPDVSATPSAGLAVAYCLHRFGLFVALNEAAHRYWPTMPLADAYEQRIARGIAMQAGVKYP